jgi:hypothetical protein
MNKEVDFWQSAKELTIKALEAALTEYGPAFVILVIVTIGFVALFYKMWRDMLREKNREIDRIAKERDKWDEVIIGLLRSSGIDKEGRLPTKEPTEKIE